MGLAVKRLVGLKPAASRHSAIDHLVHSIITRQSAAQARRELIREAYADLGDVVYYLRRNNGLVKIGHTRGLRRRLSALGAKETDLLALEPGGSARESEIHARFATANVRGDHLGVEHFRLTAPLLDHINAVRGNLGLSRIEAT